MFIGGSAGAVALAVSAVGSAAVRRTRSPSRGRNLQGATYIAEIDANGLGKGLDPKVKVQVWCSWEELKSRGECSPSGEWVSLTPDSVRAQQWLALPFLCVPASQDGVAG